MRKILEGNVIYCITEFPVVNQEILGFDLQIQPEGRTETFDVRFRRQFFTRW